MFFVYFRVELSESFEILVLFLDKSHSTIKFWSEKVLV